MIPHSLHQNPITIPLHEMPVQVTVLLLAVEVSYSCAKFFLVTTFTSPSCICRTCE